MMPKSKTGRWLGFASISATGLFAATLTIGTESDAPAVTRAAERAAASPVPGTERARDLDLALLNRPASQEVEDRLFTAPAPPPQPSPARTGAASPANGNPPKPAAPPLPFKFLGRLTDREITTAFVAYGPEALGIKEGDEIGKLYRVEAVREEKLVFVYLPLHELQTLPIGAHP